MPRFPFTFRRGLLPPKRDPRTFRLAKYLEAAKLPPAPESVDWTKHVPGWPLYGNDRIGCCGIVTEAHLVAAWTEAVGSREGDAVFPSEQDVLTTYSRVSGYNGRPATDRGVVMLDAMKDFRANGVGGHRVGAFAAIDPQDKLELTTSLWLFGGLATGFNLPKSCLSQDVWKAPINERHRRGIWAPGSLGGHAVAILGYDRQGLTCATWGQLQRMSWLFLEVYCSEAYALLSPDWFDGQRKAPSGFNVEQLAQDLREVAR